MTLDEQIEYTEKEYKAYSENKYSSPEIVDWLKSVLQSLIELKNGLDALAEAGLNH